MDVKEAIEIVTKNIKEEAIKGNIVVMTIDGPVTYNMKEFLKQPVDDILNNLKYDEESLMLLLPKALKYANDIAVSKLIRELYEQLEYKEAKIDWVSVNDRLPTQEQSNRSIKVLVTLNHRTVTNAVFDDGKFWMDGIISLDNVTDWRFLPTPPTEQEV